MNRHKVIYSTITLSLEKTTGKDQSVDFHTKC